MSTPAQHLNPFARGLRPAADLGAVKPCGTRLRYMSGCRCADCRQANTRYESDRHRARKAGDWNGIVSAMDARAHVLALSAAGVGYKTIGDASDVAHSILMEIRSGKRAFIRARTERKILAVTAACAADRALVPARELWRRLDELLKSGYTKAALARKLGYANPAIQFRRDWVTVKCEAAVFRLHRTLLGEGGLVSAAVSKRLIRGLLDEHFRRDTLQSRLGFCTAKIGPLIPSRRAAAIAKLHDELMS